MAGPTGGISASGVDWCGAAAVWGLKMPGFNRNANHVAIASVTTIAAGVRPYFQPQNMTQRQASRRLATWWSRCQLARSAASRSELLSITG